MELIHNLCLLLVWGYLSGMLSGIRQVFIKRIYLEKSDAQNLEKYI